MNYFEKRTIIEKRDFNKGEGKWSRKCVIW